MNVYQTIHKSHNKNLKVIMLQVFIFPEFKIYKNQPKTSLFILSKSLCLSQISSEIKVIFSIPSGVLEDKNILRWFLCTMYNVHVLLGYMKLFVCQNKVCKISLQTFSNASKCCQVNWSKIKINPIPAGVLENQDMLGGVNLTPPL